MNRLFFTLLLIFIIFSITISSAQEIKIEIVDAEPSGVLFRLEGEKTIKIDSIISKNEVFKFNLQGKHNGFFRLRFDSKHWLDFINDGNYVEINTDYNNISDSLKVLESKSNKLYYEFIKLNKAYKSKTELLQLILLRYPKDDDYYSATQNKLTRLQEEYIEFVNKSSQV